MPQLTQKLAHGFLILQFNIVTIWHTWFQLYKRWAKSLLCSIQKRLRCWKIISLART